MKNNNNSKLNKADKIERERRKKEQIEEKNKEK